jgi:acetyl-CoA carboxylase, biotin carboxylase subunit
VHERGEIAGALEAAQREAKNAFGDDAVYVEKYIVGPRHVEIQVLGDHYGTMLHLGERECSIQRRHQKMIEEAPSVAVTPELRARMGAAAVAAATAAGYTNAGTCEFLLDSTGAFYFLEMNTRIQVEHPVTELVTGVDLVQWQLRIAAGERLPFSQAELVPRGWAMECRITSEDPANGFLPSTGRVQYLHLPSGPGVRWDGGIEMGSEISLYYDPMLAKLIVHAPTREEAIARMHRALLELTIEGVDTSRDFHLRMLEHDDFRRGAIEIQWLERHLDELTSRRPARDAIVKAAIAAVLLAERDRAMPARVTNVQAPAAAASSGWLRAARQESVR